MLIITTANTEKDNREKTKDKSKKTKVKRENMTPFYLFTFVFCLILL